MVVVASLFNLVISSFPDNMFYHVWTRLLIYHDGSNNVVQVCSFICLRAEHEFEYICIWKLYYDFILCEYSMGLVQPIQMQQRVDDTYP